MAILERRIPNQNEYIPNNGDYTLFYRGPDLGGGVMGINYACSGIRTELNYKHYNLRGDVVLTTNSAGNVLSKMHYGAYGNIVKSYGDQPKDDFRANTKKQVYGELINDGKRHRSPTMCRFLQPDPLEYVDGLNVYLYCNNNPWGRFDAEGLELKIIQGKSANVSDVAKMQRYINRILNAKDKDGKPTESAIRMKAVIENKHKNELLLTRVSRKKAEENAAPDGSIKTGNDAEVISGSTKTDGSAAGKATINMQSHQFKYNDKTPADAESETAHEVSGHIYDYNSGIMPREKEGQDARERDVTRIENQHRKATGKPLRTISGGGELSEGEKADSDNIDRNKDSNLNRKNKDVDKVKIEKKK